MIRRLRDEALHFAVLGLIAVAGAVLRVVELGEPMRYDEAFTFIAYVSQPWDVALSKWDTTNNHLLNTALAHGSWIVFGDEEWAIRLPALLAGIATIPATYAAGRLIANRDVGLVAAAFVAASAPLVQYSTNARGYALGTLFIVATFGFGALALRTDGRARLAAWAGFGVSAFLAAYSVPSMALGIGIATIWVGLSILLELRRTVRERMMLLAGLGGSLAAAGLAGVLAYIPTFGERGWSVATRIAGTQRAIGGVGRRTGDRPGTGRTTTDDPSLTREVWDWFTDEVYLPLLVLLVIAFLAGAVLHRRAGGRGITPAAATLIGLVGAAVIGVHSPLVRTYVFLLPLIGIVVGAGVVAVCLAVRDRLRERARVLAPALAAALAITLFAGYLAAGDDVFLIDAPASDPDAPHWTNEHYPLQLVHGSGFSAASLYYFQRAGHGGFRYGSISEEEIAAGHTLVVTHVTEPYDPVQVVQLSGALVKPGVRPVAVKRWKWLTLWRAEIIPPPQ